MDDLLSIPSSSSYGKQKVRLPPTLPVSENSESSDDEEDITLKTIQAKIRPPKFLFQGDVYLLISLIYLLYHFLAAGNNSEGDFSSLEEADFEAWPTPRRKRRKLRKQHSVGPGKISLNKMRELSISHHL
ncbi:hypothetical protein HHI36_009702 [Cryptolaemus montrouzieri]|uniref:Uncharacterized protein n=1 Tax=Cryptolaemus montrouzieri TaxID=559131 RepID=A0ABD2MGJ5_9CUCU